MGSRRITTRSSSGNGRSSNGEETSVNSRPVSCSYLSNVRPETRSTLCSVIALLTEETQPSFEITLKSKAVSEKCNVKFSCVVTGHPTPQVIWYKDDMQLDRYCGLPKYEVFRNGQSHSLHIYNCTVDDAAIYQASASNIKGIVSCSGVLEVGEMNEFKIHQRYFGKLKQKAENKRREAEGKENQEPLRTISPDRTQRKRRSTMEAFLSAPSSTEDEGNEVNHEVGTMATEARLQEPAVEKVEEKQVPMTNGVMSPDANGRVISEKTIKSRANIFDTAQKTFATHQSKTPFVKKKLKIPSSPKIAKSDITEAQPNEERRATTSAARASKKPEQFTRDSVEGMEVENSVRSGSVSTNSKNVKEQHQKPQTEVLLAERPSVNAEVTLPSKREQTIASVSPAAFTPVSSTASGPEGRQAAKHEKAPGRVDTKEKFKMLNKSPPVSSAKPHSSVAASPQQHQRTVKRDVSKPVMVTPMDVDKKSNTSTGGTLTQKDTESVKAPYKSMTVAPQHPCEQAADQLSVTETSPCQKNVSMSGPALLSEVSQAHTKMNRNDASVILELPPNHCKKDAQPPQRTPSKREAMTDDRQTHSLQSGPQAAADRTTQNTQDHTKGSSVIHTALYTDLQKSSPQSPGHAENSRGCKVSPSANQSQVDTAIKTVAGTEIHVDKKVESNMTCGLLAKSDRWAPNEKVVEMETETTPPSLSGQMKTEGTAKTADHHTDVVTVDKSLKESDKNYRAFKTKEECRPELQIQKSNRLEPTIPHIPPTQESTKLSQDTITEFREITKPVAKVISIAELLRAQIKALESTLASSFNAIPLYSGDPTTRTSTELKNDNTSADLEKSTSDRRTKMSIDVSPLRNLKETLMEVYNQLYVTDQESSWVESPTPAQETIVIPPISVAEPGPNLESAGPHGSAREYNECAMDICLETTASAEVPSKHLPDVAPSGSESVSFPSSTCKEDLTNESPSNLSVSVTQEPVSPLAVTPINATDGSIPGKGNELFQRLTSEITLNTQSEEGISKMDATVLDQNRLEEIGVKTGSLQSLPKLLDDSALGTDTQEINLQLNLQVADSSQTSTPSGPTTEASPLVKTRNCVSPIPSATPQELASGARRKIVLPKAKAEEASEASSPVDNQSPKQEVSAQSSRLSPSPVALSTSPSLSRHPLLLEPPGEPTTPVERHSPLFSRRKMAPETQVPSKQLSEEINPPETEGKLAEKDKHDPFKAPQVIRKIRGETFADASGHLKLWCQFFNVLGDSTIQWYRNEKGIARMKRSAGDETQVNLAIVQASCKDAGVYGCTITNEYGTDSTDYLLSSEVMTGLSLREDLGVGEEIELTPLIFSRGVADSGVWGNKLFGRIMMQESHIGNGCLHKVWRAKVIYGLEPVFESGNTCIMKVCNPIAYGGKGESSLIDRNLEIVKQECKIHMLAREYCKIFSAEARVIEHFGPCLEVIPVYLMYRPANTVPYATVETDLPGVYQKYSVLDPTGRLDMKTASEVERKCCTLQHWIFQWTNGNLLLTRLEGVDMKITSIGISVKTTGHQGLCLEGNPKIFEQFVTQHQCNYFCGLLGLRSLKVMDSLLAPKTKGSRSPLLQRKAAAGSSSPQTGRKAGSSPRMPRKTDQEGRNTPTPQGHADASKIGKME